MHLSKQCTAKEHISFRRINSPNSQIRNAGRVSGTWWDILWDLDWHTAQVINHVASDSRSEYSTCYYRHPSVPKHYHVSFEKTYRLDAVLTKLSPLSAFRTHKAKIYCEWLMRFLSKRRHGVVKFMLREPGGWYIYKYLRCDSGRWFNWQAQSPGEQQLWCTYYYQWSISNLQISCHRTAFSTYRWWNAAFYHLNYLHYFTRCTSTRDEI